MARAIQVIEVEMPRGRGTRNDVCRLVKQYYDFSGNLLAEKDMFECLKHYRDVSSFVSVQGRKLLKEVEGETLDGDAVREIIDLIANDIRCLSEPYR